VLDPIAEANRITGTLRGISDATTDPSPVIRTELPFYGVSLGDMKRIAARWHREHGDASVSDVAALGDELWNRAVREEMVVSTMLVGHSGVTRAAVGLRRIDRWGRLLDNWETTDNFAGRMVGPWVADDPERRLATLDLLAGRRNPWLRRTALVGCVPVARREDAARWWSRVTVLVLRLADDREGGIPKAISWVLREHLRHTASEVTGFLDRHAGELPAIAVRETRTKLRTGTKTGRR
jgi:3-methyladenine DNA glycosylase AlkD